VTRRCAAFRFPTIRKSSMKTRPLHTPRQRFGVTGLSLALVLGVSACSGISQQDKNTAIGAGVGAVGGSVLTGGGALGTLGGAAIGGVIGNQVEKK